MKDSNNITYPVTEKWIGETLKGYSNPLIFKNRKPYKNNYYENRDKGTSYSAHKIISILKKSIPEIKSVVDLGCGVGTWLYPFRNQGVKVLGVDGGWVNRNFLMIEDIDFMEYDLNKELKIDIKYDLAISLEVAEHLRPESAEIFISSLTNLSDFVLFSAAIPNQGGVNHLNEQWLEYWVKLFEGRGYIGFDIFRNQIWNDELIPFHYRQNTVLFVKESRTSELIMPVGCDSPHSIVHPELYLRTICSSFSIKKSLINLFGSIKKRIWRVDNERY